jgi:fido (protein-threonine AMPylation protein)
VIYSNFEILNKSWWKNPYDERDVDYFISSIKHFQHVISLSLSDHENNELLWKGYLELHHERYLLECISTECDTDITIEFVQQVLKKPDKSSRLVKKVQNLNNAITSIFPSTFFPNHSIDDFTPLLAQKLNQHICNGLIDDAGQYRIKYVMAAQENFVYMAPYLIEDRMNELFRQCREKFGKENLQLEEAVKFGACFFTHFLNIHPFMNGNGRVARLLLSYLLSRFTAVPFSLYIGKKTRDVCLQCLRESKSSTPNALAALILESMYLTSYKICSIMDLE